MQTTQPGLYILLVLGPAEGFVDKIIQFLGLAASLLSVVKGIAEFHLYTSFNVGEEKENQKPVNLFQLLKSSTFFLPHTLFRSLSIAVIAAFIGYYAFIPFAVIFLLNAAPLILSLFKFFHWSPHFSPPLCWGLVYLITAA